MGELFQNNYNQNEITKEIIISEKLINSIGLEVMAELQPSLLLHVQYSRYMSCVPKNKQLILYLKQLILYLKQLILYLKLDPMLSY